MSKYEEMKAFYEKQLAHMEERMDRWRSEAISLGNEVHLMKGKLEVYEKLFRKFLKEPSNNDEVFIYRGKVYEPISHTLSSDLGSRDKLDVTFVERII